MTIDPSNLDGANLVDRAKGILTKPQPEWERIAGEPADVNKLYIGYLLPLLVVATVASLIGQVFIGTSAFGVTVKTPIVSGAIRAVLSIPVGLGICYIMGIVTNALAPNFGSTQDQGQAHKLIVYSMTAVLVSAVVTILPVLSILAVIGLIYSMALYWMGLPRLMKTPEDKRVGYFAAIVVIWLVIMLVFGMVMGAVMTATGGLNALMPHAANAPAAQQQQASGDQMVTLPGGGQVSVSDLERLGQQYGNSDAQPVDASRLQGYLPQTLPGGFHLVSSSNASAMGTTTAEGRYENGDARMKVEIVSLGNMGALSSIASAANVQQNEQSADGYSRTSTIDGRIYTEESRDNGRSAKYSVVGRGIALNVEGENGVTVDQVRGAVDVIGIQRLEGEVR